MAADTLFTTLTQELGLRPVQVEQCVALFDAGNTIPFVARYRKEVIDVTVLSVDLERERVSLGLAGSLVH